MQTILFHFNPRIKPENKFRVFNVLIITYSQSTRHIQTFETKKDIEKTNVMFFFFFEEGRCHVMLYPTLGNLPSIHCHFKGINHVTP